MSAARALVFEQLVLHAELRRAAPAARRGSLDGDLQARRARDVVARRVDGRRLQSALRLAAQRSISVMVSIVSPKNSSRRAWLSS